MFMLELLGNGKITAAMIADIGTDHKTPDELRLLNYVKNFTSSIFQDVNLGYPIRFKYWPPIYSKVVIIVITIIDENIIYYISSFIHRIATKKEKGGTRDEDQTLLIRKHGIILCGIALIVKMY